MGVPAFAQVGQAVWAMGLHCGVRKRFKAKVIKLRKMFPLEVTVHAVLCGWVFYGLSSDAMCSRVAA